MTGLVSRELLLPRKLNNRLPGIRGTFLLVEIFYPLPCSKSTPLKYGFWQMTSAGKLIFSTNILIIRATSCLEKWRYFSAWFQLDVTQLLKNPSSFSQQDSSCRIDAWRHAARGAYPSVVMLTRRHKINRWALNSAAQQLVNYRRTLWQCSRNPTNFPVPACNSSNLKWQEFRIRNFLHRKTKVHSQLKSLKLSKFRGFDHERSKIENK